MNTRSDTEVWRTRCLLPIVIRRVGDSIDLYQPSLYIIVRTSLRVQVESTEWIILDTYMGGVRLL